MKRFNKMKWQSYAILLSVLPKFCLASQTGVNAWEKVLTRITASLTGPVAYSISIMAIFVCGLVMAFADLQGGAKRFVQMACGISIAIFSAQILTGFMGFHGAVI